MCDVAVIKLGAEGSIIAYDDSIYRIPGFKVEVANTNGAGDMYAAGLLYAISRNYSMKEAGLIGSYTSSLIVSQAGARFDGNIDISSIKDLKGDIE